MRGCNRPAFTMNIRQTLWHASQQLADLTDSPQLDAEILLAHVLQKSRTYLFTWPEQDIDTPSQQQFSQLIEQRTKGHPIAHLIGQREFWSLNLNVTADTLIPRPETELLVEHILQLLPATPQRVADLGTGSGAIALALASERPLWQITATDQSTAALDVARNNAKKFKLKNIKFIAGNWFTPLSKQHYNAIISNPPYIANNDVHLTQGDLRFEPVSALSSGADGLDAIRHITQHAMDYLLPGGLLMVEHGYDQMLPMKIIFEKNNFINITQLFDLNNNPRATMAYKP